MKDLIFGIHSIAEAINNPARGGLELFCTEDGKKDLIKLHFKGSKIPERCKVRVLSNHQLKEEGKFALRDSGAKEQRVPSQLFLRADSLPHKSIADIYNDLESGKALKILALDQVTDVHNLGAILRTTAFYGVDYVITSKKNQDNYPPGFFRIASGATEHVPMVSASSLGKAITKLSEKGVYCFGLAEEATQENPEKSKAKSICMVMGAEETGLSHATRRVLEEFVALPARGQIKSLNVSVAAALAIEKFMFLC